MKLHTLSILKTAGWVFAFFLIMIIPAYADPTPTPCVDDDAWLERVLPEVVPDTAFNVKFTAHGGAWQVLRIEETVPEGFVVLSPPWDDLNGRTYVWNEYISSYQARTSLPEGTACFSGETLIHDCNGNVTRPIEGDQCVTWEPSPVTPTPTCTPPPPPSPTSTCPPCAPVIRAHVLSVDDTAGTCSDADGHMDAGETALMKVQFVEDSYANCTGSGGPYADISTDNPNVKIDPEHVSFGSEGWLITFEVAVGDTVVCDEPVTFIFDTVNFYCGYSLPYTTDVEYHLELDRIGEDWQCDQMPCGEPTATPQPSGMSLVMTDISIEPLDPFRLEYTIVNESASPLVVDAWLVLDIMGSLWFYPSWRPGEDGIDYSPGIAIAAGGSYRETVFDFTWPDVPGSASGLRFLGAAYDPVVGTVVGDVPCITWAYH